MEYKCIPNTNGKYAISEDSVIINTKTNRILKQGKRARDGYVSIGLNISPKKQKFFRVHRLVLLTFDPIENPEMYEVNHIDYDRSNNKRSNLEWKLPFLNTKKSKSSIKETNSYKLYKYLLKKFGNDAVEAKLIEMIKT